MNDGAIEILVLEMRAHGLDQSLPEFLARFFVHTDIADDRIFMRPRRDKNQHRISIARFLHSELKKFSFGPRQGIILKFPTLNKNTDLARSPPLRLFDRLRDSLVIEPTKKMMRAHLITSLSRRRRRRSFRHPS